MRSPTVRNSSMFSFTVSQASSRFWVVSRVRPMAVTLLSITALRLSCLQIASASREYTAWASFR
ncbi:hypothetical protein D9M69_613000 [compost metagenome]